MIVYDLKFNALNEFATYVRNSSQTIADFREIVVTNWVIVNMKPSHVG